METFILSTPICFDKSTHYDIFLFVCLPKKSFIGLNVENNSAYERLYNVHLKGYYVQILQEQLTLLL